MNIKSIRRIITLLTLMTTLTMSFAAQADALPLPEPVTTRELPTTVSVLLPHQDASLSYADLFAWKNNTVPDKYLLKMVVAETGQKIKFKIPMDHCGGAGSSCSIEARETPLFEHVQDGYAVHWQVVAKFGDVKAKSEVRTAFADSVNAPETLMPANWAVLLPVFNLSWNASDTNSLYRVIVKNAETGEVAMKRTLQYIDCDAVCAVNPHIGGELPAGSTFIWFVKVIGLNGEKAKSAKQAFVTPANVAPTR